MYDKLKDIFTNVNEWLKFAEAKHGALIALNAASLFGLLGAYSNIKDYYCVSIAITLGLISFGGSIICSFISFFPKTTNTIGISETPRYINLFFWNHTGSITTQQFIRELQESYPNIQTTRLEENLINQIIVNSQIAEKKFYYFKISLYLTFGGYSIQLIYLITKSLWQF